jgi:phosphate transport system substrate-binding protein
VRKVLSDKALNGKFLTIFLVLTSLLVLGCAEKTVVEPTSTDDSSKLSGSVAIDGSSTVFPISEAVAEEFQLANPDVRVTVGVSGTGGGFKKFCAGETDISDASRPIKQSEVEACSKNGISYIELTVAYDGLSVVVNPENDFVDYLTIDELKRIWEPESTVHKWSDVRGEWPDEEIFLVGPDTDSGTFDYFTERVVGKSGASRSDYTASADDNVLVQAVSGEKNALGYFGYAYYAENKDKLKVVPIEGGTGAVAPSAETVESGKYPLSRPLLIYVNTESLKRPEVKAFLRYYLENSKQLIEDVGYVPVSSSVQAEILEKLEVENTQ